MLPTALLPAAVPALQVTTIASGLDIPWDVRAIPGDKLLITERTRKRLLLWENGTVRALSFPSETVWASGETGLMGLAVDPDFAENRRFYTCQGGNVGASGHDVRVNAWTLNEAETAATSAGTLLSGIYASSGRHGGCRLLVTSYGALIVGTGDAATGTKPRSRSTLAGKTLKLNRFTGAPWPANPYIRSTNKKTRYILTWGHRNVQGLARRSNGTIWSVEHGSTRDDEVNMLGRGWDYGWNPVPGYNESVPMTNHSLPGTQHAARWRSGSSTIATSGASWVYGAQWGDYNGTLAVAALKGERVLFMKYDSAGRLRSTSTPTALRAYGRLRSITQLGDGDLLLTTSNGGGNDRILRVHPAG
jgi:glucose/arabinose dehydrogenase